MTDRTFSRALHLSAILALLCLSASLVWARVSVQEETAGDLTVSGTLLETRTRRPIAGERVMLMGPNPTPGERSREIGEVAISDEDGRFRFDSLAAGRYFLTAPDGLGVQTDRERAFELTAGPPPDIEIWSNPRGTVSGRVTDADGNPVTRVVVALVEPIYSLGRRTFTSSTTFGIRTDTDGRYEISAPPGRYYLRAEFLPYQGGARVSPTLYYPGEVDFERAVQLTIDPGTTLPGMDLIRRDAAPLRVQFTFPLPQAPPDLEDVQPLEAYILPLVRGPVEVRDFEIDLEDLGDDTYQTAPLPPGDYEILVRYSRELQRALPDIDWQALDPITKRMVVLEDEDVDLRMLSPDSRASIEGRVVVTGDGASGFDPTSLPEFRFGRWRPDRAMSFTASAEPDGRFSVDSVFPERYRFSFNALRPPTGSLPEGWFVEAITSGGQDVLKDGLYVSPAEDLPVEIRVSSNGGSLSGLVRSPDDELADGSLVVLIPPSPTRGPGTSFHGAVADERGSFRINSVPPGEYRVLAVDLAGRGTTIGFWEAPEFLQEYEFRGEPISIEPGERQNIDLTTVSISD